MLVCAFPVTGPPIDTEQSLDEVLLETCSPMFGERWFVHPLDLVSPIDTEQSFDGLLLGPLFALARGIFISHTGDDGRSGCRLCDCEDLPGDRAY